MRVTAKTPASAKATRPATCAPRVEEPEGSTEVFATALVSAVPPERGSGVCGATVGNRPEALPPGLSVEFEVEFTAGNDTPGTLPTGTVIDAATGLGGARMVIAPVAAGSVCRLAALPVAFRLTEVTVAAVRGTVTCAWSSRWAEVASNAPRSHREVPSSLPQPNEKSGVPALAGLAWS